VVDGVEAIQEEASVRMIATHTLEKRFKVDQRVCVVSGRHKGRTGTVQGYLEGHDYGYLIIRDDEGSLVEVHWSKVEKN